VYTCNGCQKSVETRYHCTVCDDFDLCVSCYQEKGHIHKMEKLGFDLDGGATEAAATNNPQVCNRLVIFKNKSKIILTFHLKLSYVGIWVLKKRVNCFMLVFFLLSTLSLMYIIILVTNAVVVPLEIKISIMNYYRRRVKIQSSVASSPLFMPASVEMLTVVCPLVIR